MPEPIRCARCGDEDGPFAGTPDDARCEDCAAVERRERAAAGPV